METQDNQDITSSSENDETVATETKQATTEEPSGEQQSQVPDSYELKAPDGYEQAQLEQFSELAKGLGLNNEQAQKLLDQQAEQKQQFEASALDSFKELTAQWEEQAKADSEIGGEKFERSLQYADKALTQFATPEFKQILNDSGYGNHPEMVRIFARIGQKLSEDNMVADEQRKGGEQDDAKLFYPDMS